MQIRFSMLRSYVAALIILAGLVLVASPGLGQAGGAIRPGETKSGTISQAGQADRYTLTIGTAGMYQIDQVGTSLEMDTFLRLSGQGVQLENDDIGEGSLNSSIVTLLAPGTYTITAGGYEDATGSYTLSVRQLQSRAISAGQTQRGNIATPGAQDVYMFNVAAPLSVT
ncbi:MAG: hypothetical protein JXA20_16595, partial [Spirochaetes bacterium]|nr:hypothetical protein [Spirochaetota bacterium]